MNRTQEEEDKLFEIYVICYNQMCEEIDEMTKPFRGEYIDEDNEYMKRCEICNFSYTGYGVKGDRRHNKTKTHMRCVIEENKYLLHWRAMNYINNLNSNN
jgi:hypothetical protein